MLVDRNSPRRKNENVNAVSRVIINGAISQEEHEETRAYVTVPFAQMQKEIGLERVWKCVSIDAQCAIPRRLENKKSQGNKTHACPIFHAVMIFKTTVTRGGIQNVIYELHLRLMYE